METDNEPAAIAVLDGKARCLVARASKRKRANAAHELVRPRQSAPTAYLYDCSKTATMSDAEVPTAKWSALRYGLDGQLEDHDGEASQA